MSRWWQKKLFFPFRWGHTRRRRHPRGPQAAAGGPWRRSGCRQLHSDQEEEFTTKLRRRRVRRRRRRQRPDKVCRSQVRKARGVRQRRDGRRRWRRTRLGGAADSEGDEEFGNELHFRGSDAVRRVRSVAVFERNVRFSELRRWQDVGGEHGDYLQSWRH